MDGSSTGRQERQWSGLSASSPGSPHFTHTDRLDSHDGCELSQDPRAPLSPQFTDAETEAPNLGNLTGSQSMNQSLDSKPSFKVRAPPHSPSSWRGSAPQRPRGQCCAGRETPDLTPPGGHTQHGNTMGVLAPQAGGEPGCPTPSAAWTEADISRVHGGSGHSLCRIGRSPRSSAGTAAAPLRWSEPCAPSPGSFCRC